MKTIYEDFVEMCNSSIKAGDFVCFLQCNDQPRKTKVLEGHDCSIQKIRKVKVLCEYQDKFASNNSGCIQMYKSEYEKMSTLRQSKYRFKRIVELEYYITVGRSQYQIFPSEFINLTFTNVQEAIEVQFQDLRVRSLIYSYLINRESQTADWLKIDNPIILEIGSWPRYLSDWMLQKDIHNFSRYRTKQFAKSLLSSKRGWFTE